MIAGWRVWCFAAFVLLLLAGCAAPPRLATTVTTQRANDETVTASDVDGDGRADCWHYADTAGRKRAVAFANDAGEPGPRVVLANVPAEAVPHFVIVLDGVPFDVVREMYDTGRFRFFAPPSRVICCYPAMTDLALAEMFHVLPCRAYQARRFDREAGRIIAGNDDYLEARNSPWVAQMDYRCSFWWDVLVYLDPQAVFNHELNGIVDTFAEIDRGTAFAYSVGTAGLGTRGGRDAIVAYLETLERLCDRIICERRGRVKITITADHGHNLARSRRIKFDEILAACGYEKRDLLRDDDDVAVVSYGLVTYAELYTHDPAGVAACLVQHADVEFACYPTAAALVVVDRDGRAVIRRHGDGDAARFSYTPESADPLHLAPIIDTLRAADAIDAAGAINPDALFNATIDHEYPDALRRLWQAFHGLVETPPNLIVNLRDGVCHGSGFFHAMIGDPASTHGGLNRMNATTFVLTMADDLPAALRSEEVLSTIGALPAGED